MLLSFSTYAGTGGDEKEEKIKGKHRRIVDEAEFFYSIEDHFMSQRIYEDLTELYPENAEFNFRLGFSYLHLRNQERKAVPYLEKAAAAEYTPAFYFLCEAYHMNEEFDKALEALDTYRKSPDHTLSHARIDLAEDRTRTAMKMLSNPLEVNVKKLDANVNTDFQDYAPNIDPEGKFLYFTSRREGSTGNFQDQEGNYFEDIYVSRNVVGAWTQAEPVNGPVNSDGHDANVNFSASGNSLLLYRTHRNLYSGDLYISSRGKTGWDEPVKLPMSINTDEYHEPSAAFSPDEQEIYVVSDRPGGYGGKDIYIIRKLPNGQWSEPENLGREINSAFDEDAPFISLDGHSLFFSSMGHNAIGGFDVFRAKRSADESWGNVDHLGYPINTVHDDIYFSVTADGKRGFLSSSRSNNMDIYEVDMLFEQDDLVVLKGVITDEYSGLPISATVHFMDSKTGEKFTSVITNHLTGKYVAAIIPDKKYRMIVEAMGYQDFSEKVEVKVQEKGEFKAAQKDVYLEKYQ
jgi:hypothetical protein